MALVFLVTLIYMTRDNFIFSIKVNYVILKDQSGDSQFFSINPYTGVIRTQATFDREQKSSYLIEVQSQDSSESARPGQQGQPNSGVFVQSLFIIHPHAYIYSDK